MRLIPVGSGLLLGVAGSLEHRSWLVVMSLTVLFCIQLFFCGVVIIQRHFVFSCVFLREPKITPYVHMPPPRIRQNFERTPVVLVVLVLGVVLAYSGLAIRKSLIIL
jgi:hypothetical protein